MTSRIQMRQFTIINRCNPGKTNAEAATGGVL